MYEYALQNREAVEKATIRVERINGPVLLVSGGLDGVWPAGKMSEMIMGRLGERFTSAWPRPRSGLASSTSTPALFKWRLTLPRKCS